MKQIPFLIFCLISLRLSAQVQPGSLLPCDSFDPAHDPIALKVDSSLQLLVSEFVLIKSVQARIGQDCQILKISKSRMSNGDESLLFEGIYRAKNRQQFTLWVPLLPDPQARFFYASSQALVCSAPGCNNCSILNGNCVGCCSSTNGNAIALPNPLLKVKTTLDE